MKYKYGFTQCVSTQVGCRMGCKFCASTVGGLVRNLTSGEILSQILVVNALHKADAVGNGGEKRAVTNVVLMGSGEPLDNYDNTIAFLKNVKRATSQETRNNMVPFLWVKTTSQSRMSLTWSTTTQDL